MNNYQLLLGKRSGFITGAACQRFVSLVGDRRKLPFTNYRSQGTDTGIQVRMNDTARRSV